MPFPSWTATGLREASDSAFILESSDGKIIETHGKKWTFPTARLEFNGLYSWRAPAAHIIGGWQPSSIPRECE
jgi:hypothetical protein